MIPDLSGLTDEEAGARLDDLGFINVTLVARSSSTVAPGLALGSDPAVGEEVAFDEPITVFISDGPVRRQIPDLLGRDAEDAKTILTDAGFVVVEEFVVVTPESGDVGKVISHSPEAGTELAVGSEVTIVVGRLLVTQPTIGPIIGVVG